MVKKITVSPRLTPEQLDSIIGQFIDPDKTWTILREDVDILTSDDKLVCRFRKNVLSPRDNDRLLAIHGAAKLGNTRPDASGIPPEGKYKEIISKSSGKKLRVLTSKSRSGIVGFYDTSSHFGHHHRSDNEQKCRTTAYTAAHPELYQDALPAIRRINRLFRGLVPDRYRAQHRAIKRLDPDYVIPGTVFTTVTVNKNFRTAVHRDAGDLEAGFGNLTVVSCDPRGEETFEGGYTLFPRYKIAIDMRPGDFLAMDVHEPHGNSEIFFTTKEDSTRPTRVSLVFYMREKMLRTCPV